MNQTCRSTILVLAAAILVSLGAAPGGAPEAWATEEFHAYLMPTLPDTLVIPLGQTAELDFWVDSSAHQFNAYEVSIQYDPSIAVVDSVQEGALFVDACPDRFTQQDLGAGSATFTHVLLCAGVSVDGPGTLCTFFVTPQSVGITPVTVTSDPDRTFYDAGYYIWPQHPTYPRQVVFHDAVIRVFDPTAGVEGGADALLSESRLSLDIRPNPMRGSARLHFRLPHPAGVDIHIVDPIGRAVWRWQEECAPAGWTAVTWDGRDSQGRLVPAGSYYCLVRSGAHRESARLLVLP